MKVKQLVIICIMLLCVIFINACKRNSDDKFSATDPGSISAGTKKGEVAEIISKENESSGSITATESMITNTNDLLSEVGVFSDDPNVNIERNDSVNEFEADEIESSESENSNTLGELADVPAIF